MNYFCNMSIRIVGIDPGESQSGMCVIDGNDIVAAYCISNSDLFRIISPYLLHKECTVVIEEVKPYSTRLKPQVIETIKFIGECLYRLRIEAGANCVLIARSEVKQWVFNAFPNVCLPLIEERIRKLGYITKATGEPRKPSFVFVDDKCCKEAMRYRYKLKKTGKSYSYGLKTHGWQALALVSTFSDNLMTDIIV